MRNVNPLSLPLDTAVKILFYGVILDFGSFRLRPSLDADLVTVEFWSGEQWENFDGKKMYYSSEEGVLAAFKDISKMMKEGTK